MKRGGEMKRSKPLARKTALVASPLARSAVHSNSAAQRHAPKRRAASPPAIPARVRAALAVRSGGWCELAAPGCTGTATDFAHRKAVRAGGRKGAAAVAHHVLSNALHACRRCHSNGHDHPGLAYGLGWMLREAQNPLTAPVLYRSRWVFLIDDGSVSPTPPPSLGVDQ